MILIGVFLQDSLERVSFLEKAFQVTEIYTEVVLRIFFLYFNNAKKLSRRRKYIKPSISSTRSSILDILTFELVSKAISIMLLLRNLISLSLYI